MNYPLLKKRLLFFSSLVLSVFLFTDLSAAASAKNIDSEVDQAIQKFHNEIQSGKELIEKAKGVLIFPEVVKAGFGFGGEIGDGALRVGSKSVDYYRTAAASIGFQLGAQVKTVFLLFMTDEALKGFRNSSGWEVGVDGSVALIKVGAGGSVDTTNLKQPIIGFVIGQKGLMYNLTLEGSKMSKLDQD